VAASVEQLQANILEAVTPGFRYRLLARGQSRGMIWREGVLPPDAPEFSTELSDELLSFGYALLSHGLRLLDFDGDHEIARKAFAVSAEALEAVVARGAPTKERDFHRLVAAAAYHLGRYSARAYSLLHRCLAEANLSPAERALAKLMLRDLDSLSLDLEASSIEGKYSDESFIELLSSAAELGEDDANGASEDDVILESLSSALDGNFMAAMSVVLLSFERGDSELLGKATERLGKGLEVAEELNHVPLWWVHRLAIHLVAGLWSDSFHQVLPSAGPHYSDAEEWEGLRKLFIASLFCRGKAEVELWPSQIDAARRVLEFESSLVLSLPTSAGKTRIAELCILACLAQNKRVVFVTPLRALSAQTEVTLRRTFVPLGKTVSSLYGSIGASGADVDALQSRDIVVATPEKLDFALRSNPELLDDVGLIVLDEGHMIGLGEREVRYEAQIQRLLRRPDAVGRRIVCLSAILPGGDQLEDFVAWLTADKPNGLIKNDWRPTRLRFGEIEWKTDHGRLNITVGEEQPFIQRFIVARRPAAKKLKKLFPSDQRELCIATAWRLFEDGQTVLIFCPERRSVLPYAKKIILLHNRGLIASALTEHESALSRALAVGAEWFGPDHDILQCLRLGVAVHHGELPAPFRIEVERLLREGILKVTISSPTLAQGLNLAATSLIFHGLTRNRESIKSSEFRNVVGRAGRAYVDIEGLVLYPMFDGLTKRRAEWAKLCEDMSGHEMESGLLRLVLSLMRRIVEKLKPKKIQDVIEYIAGQAAWEFPMLAKEYPEQEAEERVKWATHLMSMDTAIMSLFGDGDVPDDQVEAKLDEILGSSLFERRLARRTEAASEMLWLGLKGRAKYIWSNSTSTQRRGYFLAGVGLATGKELDAQANELEALLLQANIAIDMGDEDLAIQAISAFAEIAFQILPFGPKSLITNWKEVLELWLKGLPLTNLIEDGDNGDKAVSFIEHVFVYNLPWAMEAVRVRADAHKDALSEEMELSDYPHPHAVVALETGTLSVAAATLIQAGFASRLAAIKAVRDTAASFNSMSGLIAWLQSDEIASLSENLDWPTSESHQLWLDFVSPSGAMSIKPWKVEDYWWPIKWHGEVPDAGTALRIGSGPGREQVVFSSDFEELGVLQYNRNAEAVGVFVATASDMPDKISLEYIGPDELGTS
jgi:superfamily II DNA/RNA helicase